MPYSDFTLKKVRQDLAIAIHEGGRFFPDVPPVKPDDLLRQELEEGLPLVLARGSEKARSEWIISPVLTAVRRLLDRQISLFSGEDFTVDPSIGLNGTCDFLISKSLSQLEIQAPVVIIIEAKKENLNGGLGQCIAEMVAAQKFNAANNVNIPIIFGSVTSGTTWKFLKLEGNAVTIDITEYPLPPVEPILAFLTWMLSVN
ncbi:hypothetical protein IQ226_19975 [Dolichospermum sp. LEGE 00240]|jgi:hypothetical protein|uniref:hypothetical protein n=1 Tax=Dolichospermum sp. LEGE 00240 TaxID=1828603 RepID=UPI0018816321|nr:hypothetical protein [Dolichospermum sp. LEGE 00240]MDM3846863.1 hypothetical protein [Aphanizomenon gracile PMC638.10]MDM3848428.1 hypothetical protein [Aphanizomenon gracile PMC627.10]MDM3858088.1 hypothetical protein [Aphanizomenon gracile PMC649.10]MDM3860654.1 hypothetical protein [Aphanizomenon gracile PMC644.10]MBE9251364.1 hypothetical protein [Dolichospermum sp. LEGE 00240]